MSHPLLPEFTVMSRRPGVGKRWLDQYASDVYPGDFVIMNGKKHRPPRYYDTEFEKNSPEDHKNLKTKRKKRAIKHAKNNTTARLNVREIIQQKKLDQLERNHDSDP